MNKITKDQLEILYKMNVAAYKGISFQGNEYTLINSRDNNGYYGSAHVNQEKKQIIFTHRGTDSVNPFGADKKNYDFITEGFKNKDFIGYGDCTECNEAIIFVEEVLNGDKYKGFSIIITGHSLGALLSDVILYHLKIKNLSLDCTSIVFADPGCKPFLEKVAAQKSENFDFDLYKSISLAINLKGDNLVKHENQLGSEWFIDSGKEWPCPSITDKPICMYAGNNHMLNNIRGAINELSVEQINNGLPDGWQLSTLTKTIIEEVTALTGGSEVEVAKITIDGTDHDVKFKLDSFNSDSISGTTITITRIVAPKDVDNLVGIINALYVKKDGSGGLIIGTDTTDAKPLNCDSSIFFEKTIGTCLSINLFADDVNKKIVDTATSSLDQTNINDHNVENLKNLDVNKLKNDFSEATVNSIIQTIAINSIDFSKQEIEQMLQKYSTLTDNFVHTASELEQSADCIEFGICN